MKEVSEAAFMSDQSPDEIRSIARAKHEKLTPDMLEEVIERMLSDAKNDTIPGDLRLTHLCDEGEFDLFPLYAGAAFEVLIRKLMEQA